MFSVTLNRLKPVNDRAPRRDSKRGRDGSESGDFPSATTVDAASIRSLLLSAAVDGRGSHANREEPIFIDKLIVGELNLEGCEVLRPLRFRRCRFEHPITLRSANIPFVDLTGCHVPGINGDDCKIEGSLHCDEGFRSDGACSFSGLRAGGSLHFTGGTFNGAPVGRLEKQAIELSQADIGGAIFMNEGFSAIGQVRIRGSKVGGNVDCRGGSFHYPGRDTLVGDSAKIAGSVILSEGFKAHGKVYFKGAQIGQSFKCEGSTFFNSPPAADAMDGIEPVDDALDLGAADIGQGVSLQRSKFLGGVRLNASKIRGDLNCSGAEIRGRHPKDANPVGGDKQDFAIAARRAAIGGTVFLTQRFVAIGPLDFSDAQIEGSFRCIGAALSSRAQTRPRALILGDARIAHALVIRKADKKRSDEFGETEIKGSLVLENLHVTSFIDDKKTWPKPGDIELDGFVYTHINEFSVATRGDSRTRLRWLKRQPAIQLASEFRQQPWEQLTKVLRSMGDIAGARRVAIAKRTALRNSGTLPLLEELWHRFLGLMVGYGYRPLYAVLWSCAFIGIGWAVFSYAREVDAFTPNTPFVQVARIQHGPDWLPPGYPPLSSFWFAVDAFIPVIQLGPEDSWRPAAKPKRQIVVMSLPFDAQNDSIIAPYARALSSRLYELIDAGWLPAIYRWYKILGWIMLSLSIAAFSGLLRDD